MQSAGSDTDLLRQAAGDLGLGGGQVAGDEPKNTRAHSQTVVPVGGTPNATVPRTGRSSPLLSRVRPDDSSQPDSAVPRPSATTGRV